MTNAVDRLAAIAPAAELVGKGGAADPVAALIQQHDRGVIRDHIGDGDGFFELAALGFRRPAFANFDDLDAANSDRAARLRRALEIAVGELRLRAFFHAADREHQHAHR